MNDEHKRKNLLKKEEIGSGPHLLYDEVFLGQLDYNFM